MNTLLLLYLSLFPAKTQQINLKLAETVLNNSALIRVKIWRLNPKTNAKEYGRAGCSGTFIGPNTVLTAAHCFPDAPTITNIWVRPYTTKAAPGYAAHLVKWDKEHDLALLALEGYQTRIYAKKALSVRVGQAVVSVGSPFDFEFLLSEGIVALTSRSVREFKSHYLVHTGMINPGSSGGGAFNDEGELVGVNTMTQGNPFGWAGISMAVSIEDVKEFLR